MGLKDILGFGNSDENKDDVIPEAPVDNIDEDIDRQDEKPEETPEDAAKKGQELQMMAEKYNIPETYGGKEGDKHEILSIHGFREIGGVMHAIAYCDDRCTYDVPLTLKED